MTHPHRTALWLAAAACLLLGIATGAQTPAPTSPITSLLTPAQAATPAPANVPGPEGTWRGTLTAGGASLRLVLRVAKATDGLLTGTLDSIDQGTNIPIDRIILAGPAGDTVRLELKAIGGVFEGTMNAARSELKGTWSQGAPLPLTFTRDAMAPQPVRDATAAPSARGASTPPAAPAAPAATPDTRPITAATFPLGLPLDVHVRLPPTPFMGGDGKTYVVYEVHLTNMSARDLLLAKFDVLNGNPGGHPGGNAGGSQSGNPGAATTIASFEGAELNPIVSLPGTPSGPDGRTITGGRRAVVFLWLPFDNATAVPASLRHRVTVGELSVEGGAIAVPAQKPITIGPPLSGDNWLAANGPGRSSGHRRALIATGGAAHIAQRFATDWVRVAPTGGTFAGDQKDNKSYRAYGANALAVADAVVAAIKDGIPENVPGLNSRAVPITAETIGGNYVVLDLGGGRFAFYAHLQPGSLRVKTGDRVTRGQVLGLVGNSGNSTEPHLHFHVSNGVSPLGSEGLPYSMAGMTGMPLQNARVAFKD